MLTRRQIAGGGQSQTRSSQSQTVGAVSECIVCPVSRRGRSRPQTVTAWISCLWSFYETCEKNESRNECHRNVVVGSVEKNRIKRDVR